MIVQCQACGTKYRFDPSLLRSQGTKVRCSRCGFTWTLYPDEVIPPRGQVRSSKKRWAILIVAMVLLLLGLLGYPYREELFQRLDPLWNSLRENLPVFKPQVQFLRLIGYRLQVEGQEVFVVEGRVFNPTRRSLRRVKVEVRLLDAEGKVLARGQGVAGKYLPYQRIKDMDLQSLEAFKGTEPVDTVVPPRGQVPFSVLFISPPERVEGFQVEAVEISV